MFTLFHVKVNRCKQAVWNLKWCRKRASRQPLKSSGFILPLCICRIDQSVRQKVLPMARKVSVATLWLFLVCEEHVKVEDLGHHPKGYTILLPVSVLNFTESCQSAHRSVGNRQPGVPALDNDSKSFWKLLGILLGFRKLFKLGPLILSLTKEWKIPKEDVPQPPVVLS